jgi:glycosyltransferase involved in cell wall biosynthesis
MPTPIDKDSSDRFGRSDRSGAFGDEADQSDEVGRLELSHNCVSFWKLAVPMRVLQFFKTYYPDSYGGTEQAIFQLSQAMSANDVETDVLSLSSNPARRPASIGNHRAHYAKLNFEIASTGISFGAIREFCRLAAEADIVHYHYPWPYMDVVHFIARSKKPAVITYHSDIIRQKRLRVIHRPLEKLFFNRRRDRFHFAELYDDESDFTALSRQAARDPNRGLRNLSAGRRYVCKAPHLQRDRHRNKLC